mgnify:CR=1 FL=1
MLLSVIVLSTFYSSLVVIYLSILFTRSSSTILSYIQPRDLSPVRIFIGIILLVNLLTLFIFTLWSFLFKYLISFQGILSSSITYFLFVASLPSVLIITLAIRRVNINKHFLINSGIYLIFSGILLPIFLYQII